MKTNSIILVLIMLLVLPCVAQDFKFSCDDEVYAVVKNLGYEESSKIFDSMGKLSEKTYVATGCLINELHVVDEVKLKPTNNKKKVEAYHIVWVLRTLKYLTGRDFRGRTSYKFGEKEEEKTRKEFLTESLIRRTDGELPFFSVWMSRDIIYIAPRDAQSEIIHKWREWYAGIKDKNIGYQATKNPSKTIDTWYFE